MHQLNLARFSHFPDEMHRWLHLGMPRVLEGAPNGEPPPAAPPHLLEVLPCAPSKSTALEGDRPPGGPAVAPGVTVHQSLGARLRFTRTTLPPDVGHHGKQTW